MSTSAVVPLVFWGSTPPKHVVTCILVTYDQRTVITGSKTGQLGVWDVRQTEGSGVEVSQKVRFGVRKSSSTSCWCSAICSVMLFNTAFNFIKLKHNIIIYTDNNNNNNDDDDDDDDDDGYDDDDDDDDNDDGYDDDDDGDDK